MEERAPGDSQHRPGYMTGPPQVEHHRHDSIVGDLFAKLHNDGGEQLKSPQRLLQRGFIEYKTDLTRGV